MLADDDTLGFPEVSRSVLTILKQPHLIPQGWMQNHYNQLVNLGLEPGSQLDLREVVQGESSHFVTNYLCYV